jgi:16S rRNA (guanine(966)-N(2))-methyltransferase RsmD
MRVVAGRLRGRRLAAPPGRATRPTSDRVREALFSMLGDVSGARVLDLYAGSGALGIEALSRGAAQAVFVDADPRAVAAVRRNLAAVGADAVVVRRDAVRFLTSAAADDARYDLVFVDPPYSSARHLGRSLSERLRTVTQQNARIVTESDKRTPLDLDLPLDDERIFGDTRIAIHRAE